MRQSDLDPFEMAYSNWVEKMRDKLIFEKHQKKVLKVSRILRLYNILQKIKDQKNETNERRNK